MSSRGALGSPRGLQGRGLQGRGCAFRLPGRARPLAAGVQNTRQPGSGAGAGGASEGLLGPDVGQWVGLLRAVPAGGRRAVQALQMAAGAQMTLEGQ